MTDAPVANADVQLESEANLSRRVIAEMFGTFVLVFALIGTALFSSTNTGWLGVSLAVGISVIAAAYAVGHISGGHFNPAVTVGAAAAGRFAWRDVAPYLVAQVVGGAFATTLLYLIAAGGPLGFLAVVSANGFASNGYDEYSPGKFSLLSVVIVEFVLTAVFVYVVLGVTDRRAPSGFAPLAIGLTLTLIHLVSIPVSNTSVNPARSLATAIYGGLPAILQLWVFIVVPIGAALVAGFSYKPLFDKGLPPVP